LGDERVGRQEHTVVLDRLADEHAVERISMEAGKFVKMEHGGFMKRQLGDAVTLPLIHEESIERTRERQLAQGMFDGKLPHRDDTEKDFVGRVGEEPRGVRRKRLISRDDP
jgi:hypothetical protein